MPDALAVLILSEFGGTRAAMIGNLLQQKCADLVTVQSMSLEPAVEFPRMRALLQDLGVEHVQDPGCVQDGDMDRSDLILTLDEPSRDRVRRQRENAIEMANHYGPVCLHWPSLEPPPNAVAFAQEWIAVQALVQDLMTRGVLKVLAARREATTRLAARLTSDVQPIPPESAQTDEPPFHGLVAKSGVMRRLFRSIRKAARSDYPVLIQGETGTGKELVAQAVHQESARRNQPFVAVNCATLPENLAESELFGHVKGAFTGAVKPRRGRFELADGGTIFLDEVGDLAPLLQTKLLRVLQERCFELLRCTPTVTASCTLDGRTAFRSGRAPGNPRNGMRRPGAARPTRPAPASWRWTSRGITFSGQAVAGGRRWRQRHGTAGPSRSVPGAAQGRGGTEFCGGSGRIEGKRLLDARSCDRRHVAPALS